MVPPPRRGVLEPVVIHLLAVLFGILFLIVAAWAGYGVYALVLSERRTRLYLEQSRDERPLQLDHLSAPLRRVVEETRLLRVSLEAPLRDIGDFRRGEFSQSATQDLDAFDNMLMSITRQLDDWMRLVEALPDADRAALTDRGLGVSSIRDALSREGGAFERRNVIKAGQPAMDERLRALVDELRRLEDGLQLAPRPYR